MNISPLEYLKKEESKRVPINEYYERAERAIQDADFWTEVDRIRGSGGWRAEEERISRGEGILSRDEQERLDMEARELIEARRELLKKKKEEDEQRKQDEARVREVLSSEPALSCMLKVSPNINSTEKILQAYDEIQAFRTTAQDIVRDAVQKAMDVLWNDSTDERIFQREAIQGSGGCGWEYPHQLLDCHMGTLHKNDPNAQDYWKTSILREIGKPLFHEEYQKWYFYCHKFLERSKGKPKMPELLNRIQELEKQNEEIQKKNTILEEKFSSIRIAMNSN